MLIMTPKGLYCPSGNFHIDPSAAVENAVITHAHSDHARRGSKHYFAVKSTEPLLRIRLGKNINVTSVSYGETLQFRDVKLSFHPAGHILGSAQIRIEFLGQVWVASGDYKREPDSTCEPFESVRSDVFITEATFGTPAYCWNKTSDTAGAIYDWWQNNAARGYNSVLFAYSLGKAQRILGDLAKFDKLVHCHPATEKLNQCYRAQGINLASTVDITHLDINNRLQGELFLVPPSFMKSDMAQLLGKRYKTAFASGWMAGGGQRMEDRGQKGFVMSDHADWDDLIRTVLESKAQRIYVQHRGSGALVKKLRALGLEAYADTALFPKNPNQLSLF